MSERRFVPFESLWQMRIDVPYSLLVRDGDHAWSCGQLALDSESNVLAADDLRAQSVIVAGYIAEVLERGGMSTDHLKRLLLYYVPASDRDLERVEAMRDAFRSALGDRVLLDALPVPHFYYDGIVLEVDAFAGPTTDDRFDWVSIETPSVDLTQALDQIDTTDVLTAHWFVPSRDIAVASAELERRGLIHDAGAVVSASNATDLVRGSIVRIANGTVIGDASTHGDVRVTSKRSDNVGWIGARSTNKTLGLVEQTEQIMEALASTLAEEGVDFDAVVKSTTLYVGGSSEEDLHDNMSVRNRRYHKPGPASTGLPVFGFADQNTLLSVDVTYVATSS